ncbi:MAG: pullulanase, type [Herbinix sp.]|jgi:pullulanase|nr:pullulanase, type [Herbinix sp.]
MQRKIKAVVMAVILIAITVLGAVQPMVTVKAAQQYTINLHYHRYGGDYDGWNVWSWPAGGEGAAFEFGAEDEFGKVATYTLEVGDDISQIGFIIRQSTSSNAWNLKDTNSDRFIDVTKAKDGVIDIYAVQDDPNFGYTEDEMSLAPKILEAAIENASQIDFRVSTAFDSTAADLASKVVVKDTEGVTYPVKEVTSDAGKEALSASVIMEQPLDLFKKYTLVFGDFGEMTVSNVKVFSTPEFEEAFYYEGSDLGAIWSEQETNFRLWAPTATEVVLNLFEEGIGINTIENIPMTKDVKGTWVTTKTGDWNGIYYTYSVTVDGVTKEAVDPYAKATGVNGDRGMIINLAATNPEGFENDTKPALVSATDAVIYELHIRDFSVDKSSGIKNKGKYLAFTEKGTTNSKGDKTGIDYLVDLGVTSVHLLPSFDYATVDETMLVNNQFNWGYDPENYNVPEGSYSTNPQQGEVRVNEYKQMVQSLHESNIRVIMDVVYNHTSSNTDSNLNKVVPGYYYRMNDDGTFSNASGCGNETASERAMMRKYIVDSVVYWATEYHVDGFRFDLMGIHDIDTMNAVRAALDKIDPTIMVYGEGWTAGSSPLPDDQKALKANMASMDSDIAAFSDDLRDGIKGSVFDSQDRGFVSGKAGMENIIKFGVVGSTDHPQIDYSLLNYSTAWWAKEPTQTVSYASAHDNNTLWDKLAISNAEDSEADRKKMNMLSSAIVLTSQGIPFFQAGEEILRSKPREDGSGFDENSYNSTDAVNSIKWDTVTTNKDVYEYYKGLIAFRKAHAALRMTTTADVQANLTFLDGLDDNVVAYTINNSPNGEAAKAICVIFNANKAATAVTVPEGDWNVYVKGDKAGTEILETISGGSVSVDPISTLVLVQEDKTIEPTDTPAADDGQSTDSSDEKASTNVAVIFAAIGAAVLVIAGAIVVFFKKRKK